MPQKHPCLICSYPHVGAVSLVATHHMDADEISCPRCGSYLAGPFAKAVLKEFSAEQRADVSIAVRQNHISGGDPIPIDQSTVEEILASSPPRLSLFEGVDRALLYLAARAPSHFAQITFHKEIDFPALRFKSEREMNDALVAAARLGYFESDKSRITVDGWRRILELRRDAPNSRQAFVAMWFAKELDEGWEQGFKPGIDSTGLFDAIRVSAIEHNDKIDDRIVAEIRRSGLVVADFTGDRGGVYFEAGFAMGLGIPVIWTCRKDWFDKVHFDTR